MFDDAFRNGYLNVSSAATDPAAKSPVKRGTRSIKITPSNRLSFSTRGPSTDGSRYGNLRLWMYTKGPGGQKIDVVAYSNTQAERGRVSINTVMGSPLPVGVWRELVVPLSALNSSSGSIGGFALQDTSGGRQADIWIDDLRLVEQALAVTPTTVPVTVVPTTVPATPTTLPATTTVPTVPPSTVVQTGPLALVAPSTATAGVAFGITVTGANGGRVDFMLGGNPIGTAQVDAAGKASIVGTAWTPGIVKIEAIWVTYVGGVPTEKTVSALVIVT